MLIIRNPSDSFIGPRGLFVAWCLRKNEQMLHPSALTVLLGEWQMSLYPISRNSLASGSPKKPWASAHRLMAAGKSSSAARLKRRPVSHVLV